MGEEGGFDYKETKGELWEVDLCHLLGLVWVTQFHTFIRAQTHHRTVH